MATPASRVSRKSDPGRSSSGTPSSAEPAARAAAVVVEITIRRVLVASPPTAGPARLADRPYTGFTPASTLDAMPSGTLATAPGRPARASPRSSVRLGRTSRHQRATAPSRGLTSGPPSQAQQDDGGDRR